MPTKNKNSAGLCIAGTHSGCGKTTVTLGIMAALKKRGHIVQPFKVGPDFIDPGHHRRITGRDSHNLDGWIMDMAQNQEIFSRYSGDADLSVVEGVMGLFDGFSGSDEAGSTAQMAKWLGLPVFLVVDAGAMARSAAAIALGFSRFDPGLSLKGIIFNRVGSKAHGAMLVDAMDSIPDMPVIGCLPRDKNLEIPSRHLGLITDGDFAIDEDRIELLGHWIEENIDVDSLAEFQMISAKPLKRPTRKNALIHGSAQKTITIGIAMDEAFCFYYQENLRLLRKAGAHLEFFSPLHSEHLPPGINGLILGGGYPELHCRRLSENHTLLREIREFGFEGRPIYAECGGLMFLMKEIQDLEGEVFPMTGIFPMAVRMNSSLKALGYREVVTQKQSMLGPSGTCIRGHEFHYSQITDSNRPVERIYSMTDRNHRHSEEEGFFKYRVLGSYVHLHWGSNPAVAGHFVDYCRRSDV
ncbi:MAG: cobyrinate a,c-diamide synthase [Thermodesulfobacteriota bacterium]|nr:cobyrinate a,c-diamide synthase [Thermodesulfobacteriota bacterium]